jgi:hypothetical protein
MGKNAMNLRMNLRETRLTAEGKYLRASLAAEKMKQRFKDAHIRELEQRQRRILIRALNEWETSGTPS